jgi:hypothetical protein
MARPSFGARIDAIRDQLDRLERDLRGGMPLGRGARAAAANDLHRAQCVLDLASDWAHIADKRAARRKRSK